METKEMFTYEEYVMFLVALRREETVLKEIGNERLFDVIREIQRKVLPLVPEEMR